MLPRGTTAIRLALTAVVGPEVSVRVLSGRRLLATGSRGAGWEGDSVTVPVRSTASVPSASAAGRRGKHISVCFALNRLNGTVGMLGVHTHDDPAVGREGKRLPGRLRVEYLRPGSKPWWSTALATARRLGLGRAASGTWNAALVGALAGMLIALSCWLVSRELR